MLWKLVIIKLTMLQANLSKEEFWKYLCRIDKMKEGPMSGKMSSIIRGKHAPHLMFNHH